MNINRSMVSLFFDIKRSLPAEVRHSMKISAPDIGERLVQIYSLTDNHGTQELIESFLKQAGEDWSSRLTSARTAIIATPQTENQSTLIKRLINAI